MVVGRSLGEGGRSGKIPGAERSSGSQRAPGFWPCLFRCSSGNGILWGEGETGELQGISLLCNAMMVIQDQGFPGPDGVFLRFGHLVKDVKEMMGLQQFICYWFRARFSWGLCLLKSTDTESGPLSLLPCHSIKTVLPLSVAKTTHLSLISVLLFVIDLHMLILYWITGGLEGFAEG